MPASSDHGKVAATLDAARVLIADADAAERPPATANAEAGVRDWWARRRESAPRMILGLVIARAVNIFK